MCPKCGGVGEGGRSLIQISEGQHVSSVTQPENPEPSISRAGNDLVNQSKTLEPNISRAGNDLVNQSGTPEPSVSRAGDDFEVGDTNINIVEELVTIPISNEECDTSLPDNEIIVCQLRSSSTFTVNVIVEGVHVCAIVDTAAEVTIISDRILAKLSTPPPVLRSVTLNTASRDLKMEGKVVGPIELCLGSRTFNEVVYSAPIIIPQFDLVHVPRTLHSEVP